MHSLTHLLQQRRLWHSASAATTAAIAASVAVAAVPPESREHEISSPADSSSGRTGGGGSGCINGSGSGGGRTKRMRTSFKHQQLKKMKSYFAMNHNPDSKALKELSQETNLSKRVLQVWFQNARAKWRRSVLRQAAAGPDVVKEPTSLTELPELSSSTSDAPSSYSLPFDTGSSSNSCPYEVSSCTTPQLVPTGGYTTSWQWTREEEGSMDIVHQTPSFDDNVLVDEISSCKQSVKRYNTKGVSNSGKIPRKRGRKPMSACERI